MPTIDEELLALKQQYRRDNNLDLLTAILGDKNGVVPDPTRPDSYVLVRVQTSNGLSFARSVMVPSGKYLKMRAGTPVQLEYDKRGNLRIAEPDTPAMLSAGQSPLASTKPDPQRTPETEALRCIPTNPPSMSVVLKSWGPIINNIAYEFGGARIDLTAPVDYRPAAGQMRLVMISVKNDYATIEITASTSRPISDVPLGLADKQECLNAKTPSSTSAAAIRLTGDMTAIHIEDINADGFDLRQIVNTSEGTASGDVVGPASSTDNAIARFNGATGKAIQNSTPTIDDTGNLNLGDNALLQALYADFKSAAAPANPSAGYGRVYFDTADGHLKQRDSAGSVTDLASSGGGATVDMTGTAGENLSARDAVYLNPSDNQWYKIDIDATATVKVAKFRGLATAAINSAATGTIRLAGALTGFTSLTAGADVYASTTAGGYTQTKPTVSAAGGQRAIVRLGFADSTTSVVVEKSSVVFAKRESLANAATLTIEHYADPLARERLVRAYISVTSPVVLTSYATTNQDTEVELRGRSGAGGTTTITASGTFLGIGTAAGSTYRVGQSFQVTAGILSQFTVAWGASTGTPTGTVTWSIQTDNAGIPSGTALATGTFTPTASSTDTISVSSGPFLAASTTYWLCIQSTTPQTGDNYWHWQAQTPGTYANGQAKQDANSAGTWSNQAADYDAQCSITTSAITSYDKLAQSFQIGSTSTCDKVRLYLRKYGSPTGTMTLRVETDSAGAPSGTLVDANATITVAESGLTTSLALVSFDFTNFSLTGSTSYWLVLSTDRAQSNTNYITWGADGSSPGYTDGAMDGYASAAWSALSKDAILYVDGPDTTYEAPMLVDQWGSSLAVALARYDDGAGANGDVDTTLKNNVGSTVDITGVVVLP